MSDYKRPHGITDWIALVATLLLSGCGAPEARSGAADPTTPLAVTTATGMQPVATPGTASTSPRIATAFAATRTRTFSTPTRATIPGPDFAFTFDARPCGIGKLDTFDGTFTTKITLSEPDLIVRLVLSEAERASIYRKMVAIDSFDYPEQFSIIPPPGGPVMGQAPVSVYRFSVRDGARLKEVSWTATISGPDTVESTNLRALIRLIEQTIMNHPEYRRLPPRKFGCA